jgi:hypothetical protein
MLLIAYQASPVMIRTSGLMGVGYDRDMARQRRWRGRSTTGVTFLTLWFIAYFGVVWGAHSLLSPIFPHKAFLIAALLGLLVVLRGYRPVLWQLRRAQSVIRQLGIIWIFSESAREATDSRKLNS